MSDDLLLEVDDLTKHFAVTGGERRHEVVHAVDGVSFSVRRGETLGLVGESGCGKTTTGRLLIRLIDPTSGTVRFEGTDVTSLSGSKLKRVRARMQMIFQDPYASLNPRLPIGDIIEEGLRNFGLGKRAERRERVGAILEQVGLDRRYTNRYPHEFSGGQRQRIGIARALVMRPAFVVADEPVSALDVSIQAQVLNLLRDLQQELSLTYVFISHNLSVVQYVSDRVGVMYLGKLVELAPARTLYTAPKHPYTQSLLSAIPQPTVAARRKRVILQGDLPSPIHPPSGCRFRTRCPIAQPICAEQPPPLEPKGGDEQHVVACHFADTERGEAFAKQALAGA